MRAIIPAIAVLCMIMPALADDVVVGRLTYSNVTVAGFDKGILVFTASTGSRITRPLNEITSIRIAGLLDFNLAETFMAEGKPAEAASHYQAAINAAAEAWLRQMITYRQIAAMDKSGQIDVATQQWLIVCETSKAARAALAIRPTTPAEKGSKANAVAMAMLEGKLESVENARFKTAIAELLVALYRQEELNDKLIAIGAASSAPAQVDPPSQQDSQPQQDTLPAEEEQPRLQDSQVLQPDQPAAVVPVPPTPPTAESRPTHRLNGTTVEPPPQPSSTPVVQQAQGPFAHLGDLLAQGQAQRVVDNLAPRLRGVSEADLPAALLLLARAQLAVGETGDRQALLRAGLSAMRVAAFYPASPEAGEALYVAGRACEALGDLAAASRAYRGVLTRYPASASVGAAAAALDKLRQQSSAAAQ